MSTIDRSVNVQTRQRTVPPFERLERIFQIEELGASYAGKCAVTITSGIEMVHMMRKRQARYVFNPAPSLAEQFEILSL